MNAGESVRTVRLKVAAVTITARGRGFRRGKRGPWRRFGVLLLTVLGDGLLHRPVDLRTQLGQEAELPLPRAAATACLDGEAPLPSNTPSRFNLTITHKSIGAADEIKGFLEDSFIFSRIYEGDLLRPPVP